MTTTRVAVVGYGYWGSKHVRVLSSLPGVHVTVVEAHEDRLADAGRAFPSVRLARSLDDALDDVDAVVVVTPPASHHAVAARALEAGKHTLVEKPLTTSTVEAEHLIDLAERADVNLMVGNTFEYNPAVWKLKEIIASGTLGRILYIDSARLSLGLYQNDVNVVWDLAPHDLSIITYLLDEMPSAVAAWGQSHAGHQQIDVAYLRLEFEKRQTPAFVHVSWLDPCKVRRVTVVGEQKMVVYNDMSDSERIRIYDCGVEPPDPSELTEQYAMPVSYRTGDIVAPYVAFQEPLRVQDAHFIESARSNSPTRTPGRRGAEIVEVLVAADQSLTRHGDLVPVGIDLTAPVEAARSASA